MNNAPVKCILAADIGGTKTNMALYTCQDGFKLDLQYKAQYASKAINHFSEIVSDFLSENRSVIDAACFGIAGPVIAGICQTTNLPWTISTETLQKKLNTPNVKLLNDLESTAYGMLYLDEASFVNLNPTAKRQNGNRAVIAAGTGLGEALLFFNGKGYMPIGTEGGHCDFAPADEQQSELLIWLRKRYPEHVSVERVLSGPGLINIYNFLRDSGTFSESEFMQRLSKSEDKSAAISKGAQQMNDPLCHEALKLFVRIYAAESGNLALKSLSAGGVMIGGGIAPKILPYLQNYFMDTFTSKGRFKPLLSDMPVHVSLEQETSLLGAAFFARDSLF